MLRRWVLIGVGLATAASLLSACGGNTAGASSSKAPITIGMTASLTGAYSVDGTSAYRGVELAVAQANANGGWLGRKLKLDVIDDTSDPTVTAEAYTKLITQDHVDFIIGPYSPTLGQAVAGIAARYHYVMLDPQTATPLGNKWAIQDEPSASQVYAGLPTLAKANGLDSLAILEINNAYGSECADALRSAATSAGMQIVYETSYQISGPFDSVAQRVKAANAQVVADCGFYPDGVSITRALNNANYRPRILAESVAPSESTFASSLGSLANGVVGAAPWWPSLPTPGNKAFIAAFQQEFGFAPEYHPAVDYAAVECLGAAVKKANSIDNTKVLDTLYSSVFPTVIGNCKIRSVDGSGIGVDFNYMMWQIQNGGVRKLIWPKNFAEAPIQLS